MNAEHTAQKLSGYLVSGYGLNELCVCVRAPNICAHMFALHLSKARRSEALVRVEGSFVQNFVRRECGESGEREGVGTRSVNRLDTEQRGSSSTAGTANWMVINGMEADKYLCERACRGHGSNGREMESRSAHKRERERGESYRTDTFSSS